MGENRGFRCGCKLVIDSDFKGSEIGLVSEDKAFTEEDIDVTLMSCPHCGMKYELYDIPESEQEDFPYFNPSL